MCLGLTSQSSAEVTDHFSALYTFAKLLAHDETFEDAELED